MKFVKSILPWVKKDFFTRLSSLTILAALFLFLLVIGVLIYKLPSLSSNPNHWGAFGDYVGGTLGTVVAAFALVWLIYAVYSQRIALDTVKKHFEEESAKKDLELDTVKKHFEEESVKKDLKIVIDDLHKQISEEYDLWIEFVSASATRDIWDAIGCVGTSSKPVNRPIADGDTRIEFAYTRAIDFAKLFNLLAYHLREYDNNSSNKKGSVEKGSTAASTYFTTWIAEKYIPTVRGLIDFTLTIDNETAVYFHPECKFESTGGSVHQENIKYESEENRKRWEKIHGKP